MNENNSLQEWKEYQKIDNQIRNLLLANENLEHETQDLKSQLEESKANQNFWKQIFLANERKLILKNTWRKKSTWAWNI